LRAIRHPGPPLEPRLLAARSDSSGEFAIELGAGADLLATLADALERLGVDTAGIRFAGGYLDRIGFVTGVIDPTGYRIATHSAPTDLEGPIVLIGGSAILGRGSAERLQLHCHAAFAAADGAARSGHLLPGRCPVGGGGARAFVTSTGSAHFAVVFDPETNFPLMQPAPTA
jgi:predicted DNA-binding protein with PD1-like motif